jgi:hypothetical protein
VFDAFADQEFGDQIAALHTRHDCVPCFYLREKCGNSEAYTSMWEAGAVRKVGVGSLAGNGR